MGKHQRLQNFRIDAILSNPMFRPGLKVAMSENSRASVHGHRFETQSNPFFPNLFGVKTGHGQMSKSFDDSLEHRGLTDTRVACQKNILDHEVLSRDHA